MLGLDFIFTWLINFLGLTFICSVLYVLSWLFMTHVKKRFLEFWGK